MALVAFISARCCFTCKKSISVKYLHEGRSNLSTPRGCRERGNYPPTYRRPTHEYHLMLITSFPATQFPISSTSRSDYNLPFLYLLTSFLCIIFVFSLYFSVFLALIFPSSVGRSIRRLNYCWTRQHSHSWLHITSRSMIKIYFLS
jgi:hypothetical protein